MSDNTNLQKDDITNDINDENMLSLTEAPITTFTELIETEEEKLNSTHQLQHKSVKLPHDEESTHILDNIPKPTDETESLKSVSSYDEIISVSPNHPNFNWFSTRE